MVKETQYCFIGDNDGHWYLISENSRELFRQWVEDMENDILTNIDFDNNRINHPTDFCFTNPINCLTNEEVITAESQKKHFNLLKIHVITSDDMQMFIADGICTNLKDLDVSTTDFDWDYAQRALVNVDENKVIMWNDNIHTDIDNDIDNFLDGITYVGNTYSLTEACMLEDDMRQYEGVRYR